MIARRPNVCNCLHMPAQSGSTAMLERMARGYSREAYLALIDRVKEIIPGCAITTDIIAGFCHETEEEHADTVSLMTRVGYEQAFMFAYSERVGTRRRDEVRSPGERVPARGEAAGIGAREVGRAPSMARLIFS